MKTDVRFNEGQESVRLDEWSKVSVAEGSEQPEGRDARRAGDPDGPWHEAVGPGPTPDGQLTLTGGKIVSMEPDLTPKSTKDFERVLRTRPHERVEKVGWDVLPCVVP